VQADPFDSDAWIVLVMEAQQQPIEKARDTYHREEIPLFSQHVHT
jgi:hypothetical protein